MHDALAVADAILLRRTVENLPRVIAEPASAIGKAADGGALWFGLAGFMAVAGNKGRRAARAGLAAYGITAALANGPAKWAARRPRPRGLLLAGLPRRGRRPGTSSFPSSHTAAAAAFAVASSSELPMAAPLLVTTATAVALSRMRAVRHYPTDVVGGAALGIAVGALVGWVSRRRGRASRQPAAAAAPEAAASS